MLKMAQMPYVIGHKGMGIEDMLKVPETFSKCLTAKQREQDIWSQWKTVASKMKGIRTHAFYLDATKADAKNFRSLKAWINDNDKFRRNYEERNVS